MSISSKFMTNNNGSVSGIIDAEDWWGGKDQQLEATLPPSVEWGFLPNSPLSGRSTSRSGQRPSSQEYAPGSRPKTAPAWSGSDNHDWDQRHHISFSRNNTAFPSSLREYFPSKPKVPMARNSMHSESFAPLNHVTGKSCLFQRPPPADASHSPKFSHDIWRQADPYLSDDGISVNGVSVNTLSQSQSGSITSEIGERKGMRNFELNAEWDDRASTSISKHNGRLHSNQRQYFFYESSSFSSPPDFYHNQKWRNVSPGKRSHLQGVRKSKSERKNAVFPER